MNLVANAAEAQPDGGSITIKTENRYLDLPLKGNERVKEGDYVVLTVTDTGTGISAVDLPRIKHSADHHDPSRTAGCYCQRICGNDRVREVQSRARISIFENPIPWKISDLPSIMNSCANNGVVLLVLANLMEGGSHARAICLCTASDH